MRYLSGPERDLHGHIQTVAPVLHHEQTRLILSGNGARADVRFRPDGACLRAAAYSTYKSPLIDQIDHGDRIRAAAITGGCGTQH